MKKLLILLLLIAVGIINKDRIVKEVKIVQIKLELKEINRISKQLEYHNKHYGRSVPVSYWEKLKKDKKEYEKRLYELKQ